MKLSVQACDAISTLIVKLGIEPTLENKSLVLLMLKIAFTEGRINAFEQALADKYAQNSSLPSHLD